MNTEAKLRAFAKYLQEKGNWGGSSGTFEPTPAEQAQDEIASMLSDIGNRLEQILDDRNI
jgi:hypothetical protein